MRTRPGSPPGSHAHLSFRKLSIIQSGSIFINQVKHNKKKTQLKAKAAPNYINIETHAQHTPTQTYSHTCTLTDAGRTSKIPRVLDAQTERRNVWYLTAPKISHRAPNKVYFQFHQSIFYPSSKNVCEYLKKHVELILTRSNLYPYTDIYIYIHWHLMLNKRGGLMAARAAAAAK